MCEEKETAVSVIANTAVERNQVIEVLPFVENNESGRHDHGKTQNIVPFQRLA